MGVPLLAASLAVLAARAASEPLCLLQTGLKTAQGDSSLAPAQPASVQSPVQSLNETWCGYNKQPGKMAVLTNNATNMDFLVDLTEAFAESKRIRLLITAISTSSSYHDGTGYGMNRFGYPMEDSTTSYFEFQLSDSGTEVEVHAPEMTVRSTDVQMDYALDRAIGSSMLGTFSTMSCNAPPTMGLAASLGRNAPGASLSQRNTTVPPAAPGEATKRIVIAGKDLLAQGFMVTTQYAGMASTLKRARSYPNNIDVVVDYGGTQGIGYSMVILPATPMIPRIADDRLLYFTTDYKDMGQHEIGNNERPVKAVDSEVSVIWRFDLASLPGNQIRIHVDHSVPERWREFFRQGIEGWNDAFALIGRPNAVKGLCPGDADWPADYDISDARYSTVAYSVGDEVVSMGVAKVDPRTGQIIKSDITMGDGWVKAWLGDLDMFMPNVTYTIDERNGFHTETRSTSAEGASLQHQLDLLGRDPAPGVSLLSLGARTKEEEEDYIGQGMRQVVMHETGHILGLRHNFKGSMGVSYNCTQNMSCSAIHGLTASVMDYLPLNFPEKGNSEPVHHFSPVVGAYDKAAIRYGYMEADDRAWLVSRTRAPELVDVAFEGEAFQTCYDGEADLQDPSCMRYDLSADPVRYFEARLAAIADRQQNVLNTSVLPGGSYKAFGNGVHKLFYEAGNTGLLLVEWMGGMNNTHAHRARDGAMVHAPVRAPMPAEMQRKGLSVLLTLFHPFENGYLPKEEDMKYLLEGKTFDAVKSEDVPYDAGHVSKVVMAKMLGPAFLERVDSQERHSGATGFSLTEYLSTMQEDLLGGKRLLNLNSDDWNVQGFFVDNLILAFKDTLLSAAISAEVLAQIESADKLIVEAIGVLQDSSPGALTEDQRRTMDASAAEAITDRHPTMSREDILQAHLLQLHNKLYSGICESMNNNCVLRALVGSDRPHRSGAAPAAPAAALFVAVALGLALRA